jgi:uncharacterized protein (DUF2252 family)
MNIVKASRDYEAWLARHTSIVNADLELKHRAMAEAPFPFFRATFYRWAQLWPDLCSDLSQAPKILAVGDLHVENFGTWRDVEGRLIWGVNDFDEAAEMPYTIDLVRLATSALLASHGGHFAISSREACAAILEWYSRSLEEGGKPLVLAEKNAWLRDTATGKLRDPKRFWKKMAALPPFRGRLPVSARDAIERLLPEPGIPYTVHRRVAGLGSLGHQRLTAIADWRGGKICREAKALVPSAVFWVANSDPADINYQAIIDRAVRCPDNFVCLGGNWIVRRLSPYCSRIELVELPKSRNEYRLLAAMGWETANIHLGSKRTKDIRKHLKSLPEGWLYSFAKKMLEATVADWKTWRKAQA